MSPTPGRSTLMQSAPSQASSWVQVGPDCTWVKSRILTPSSALPMGISESQSSGWGEGALLPLQRALRIEVADAAARAAGGRVDHRVDQGRLAGIHRRVHG